MIGPNQVSEPYVTSGQGYYGPYVVGSTVFAVLRGASGGEVWSKPISGDTWTKQADSPLTEVGQSPGDTYFDGSTIWYLARNGSDNQLLTFNCLSLNWAVASDPGGSSLWSLNFIVIQPLLDGDVLVFGTQAVSKDMGYYKISGGSWGSFTVFRSAVGPFATSSGIIGVAIDQSSGTVHFMYADGNGTPGYFYRKRLMAGGTLSSEQSVSIGSFNSSIGLFGGGSSFSGVTTAIRDNKLFVIKTKRPSFPTEAGSTVLVSSALDDTTTNPTSWSVVTGFGIPQDTDSQIVIGAEFGFSDTLRLMADYGVYPIGEDCSSASNNSYYSEISTTHDFYLYTHGYKYDASSNIVEDKLWASKWNGTLFEAGAVAIDFQSPFPSDGNVCGPGGQGWGGGNEAAFTSVQYELVSSPNLIESASDTITLSDHAANNYSQGQDFGDSLTGFTDSVATSMSGISSPEDTIVPPTPGTGVPPPNIPPSQAGGPGLSTCIFEFYEMQKPEDVEVLPVPKRFDQLGPMRFDKIGKIFALRIRLIMNGTTTSLPFAIYGDDSETSPHLNSPLYSDSFAVRPGFDNVYEIQLPKSVNTDIFRLTLGPVADSFHRYNVIVKVHISGMQGQAKWLPIR